MEKKTSGFYGDKAPELVGISVHDERSATARDHFYEKLGKLNETSGLSFVFNFRETMLDLHHLYEEVIQKGGFYQVTKIGKWDDVASALNWKSLGKISATQLQSVYETLLLQYELVYCREIPREAKTSPGKGSGLYSGGKRKHFDDLSVSMAQSGDVNGMADKRKFSDDSCQLVSGHKTMHNYSTIIASPNVKDFVEIHDAPVKPRTGYQIFLKLETKRLKMIHGETSSSHNLREMATQAWRSLSDIDKQPYMEASKMDKERYEKEMAAYEQLQNNQNAKSRSSVSNSIPNMLSFSTPAETDNVYHVSLETTDCNDHVVSPGESMVELAIETMKSAQSNDPMFQIDWDYSSLDLPYQMNDEGTFCMGGA